MEDAFDNFSRERRQLARQTWIIGWKGIFGVAMGMGIMVVTSLTLTWREKKQRDALSADYQSIKIQMEAVNAENRMIKTRCGDKLCIKIDPDAGKWGEHGEFAVPVLKE